MPRQRRLWRWRDNYRLLFRRPRTFLRLYYTPLVVLAFGAVLDAASTVYVMEAYGIEGELHPMIRLLARHLGIGAGVVLGKAIQVALAVLVAAAWRTWCAFLLTLSGVLYLLAAAWNYYFHG